MQRDRVAMVIHGWSRASRALGKELPDSRAVVEPLLSSLCATLQVHHTMAGLAAAYLTSDGSWPAELPPLEGPVASEHAATIVAAGYWRRYQELLNEATDPRPTTQAVSAPPSPVPPPAALGERLGMLEIVYTIKFWQRGPLRLRCLSPERRPRYDGFVARVYERIAHCQSVRALATEYYGNGDWILELGKELLLPIGEPPSNIGWVQDAAYWRRYQELVESGALREEKDSVEHANFALWLAGQMSRHRLSVAELARRLGRREDDVRSWLRAVSAPDADDSRRLAATFGVAEIHLPQLSEFAA